MHRSLALTFAITTLVATTAHAQNAQQRREWNQPQAPFALVANVYYVGTQGLAAYLVTGPSGHVLIDGGLPESAKLIAANIRKLGFKLRDVKWILINHTHFDHAGGLAELERLTGAKLAASAAQKADLEAGKTLGRPELEGFPKARVDRVIADGDTVTVGDVTLTAYASPGHTKGGMTFATTAAGKRVLFVTSLTVAGQKLVGDTFYPTAAEDFRATFTKLRGLTADVFLSFHPEFYDMQEKRARQQKGEVDAFVDASELGRQVDDAERNFVSVLAAAQAP